MSGPSTFTHVFRIEAPRTRVFGLFSNPAYLNLLTPSWFDLRILGAPSVDLGVGSRLSYKLRWRGLPLRWTSVITKWDPPRHFTYEQAQGPYRFFRHEHHFRSIGQATEVTDRVQFRTPGGPLADRFFAGPDLRRIFSYREGRAVETLGPFGDSAAIPRKTARQIQRSMRTTAS